MRPLHQRSRRNATVNPEGFWQQLAPEHDFQNLIIGGQNCVVHKHSMSSALTLSICPNQHARRHAFGRPGVTSEQKVAKRVRHCCKAHASKQIGA
eukprot:scaffold83484_cov17-Tisochrysis_lutea.AAC.2